jgi:hypothetical protein
MELGERAQVHVHHWQMFGKCRCILNKIIKIQLESYLTLKYMNPYGSSLEQRVSQWKEHGDVVCAATKGTATCCVLLRRAWWHAICCHEGHSDMLCAAMKGTATCCMLLWRVWQHAVCCCEGHSNMLHAAMRGIATQYMQLWGQGDILCAAIKATAMYCMQP